jgi:hypothetical protein
VRLIIRQDQPRAPWRGWAIIEEIMLYVCWFLFLWFAIHYGWPK